MRKRGSWKRFASLLTMAVMMALCVDASLVVPARAEGDKTIFGLGTAGIENPSSGNGGWSKVYFGSKGAPILFNVLKNGETNFGGNTLLLDCATILEARAFHGEEPYSKVWGSSPIKTYLNGDFKTNRFTTQEIAAIHESNKSAKGTGDGDGWSFLGWASLNGEKIFLLDAKEATNTSYGFANTDNSSSTRVKTGANGWWWLRSPVSDHGFYAGCGNDDGEVSYRNVDSDYAGVSPALNVNLASVIFSSEISSKIYKLTIADTGTTIGIQTGEPITRESATTITVPYTKDANSNHVSLLVTDANTTWSSDSGWSSGAEKKYYATAAVTATETSGTVTLTLPNDFEPNNDSYKVWLLAEKVNAGNVTDYVSAPLAITVPHWHNFTYTAGTGDQANTITATCENAGCDITTGLTMTISAPTNLTFDGQPKAATLNTDYNKTAFPGIYTISYEGTGSTTYNNTDAPTNAGDYKATVTVGTATAEVSFTIAPASVNLTANSRDTDVYDGTAKTVTGFTSSVDGLTFAETVTASGSGTNAGEYDVTFSGVTVDTTRDTTGNYVVTETTDGTLTINRKDVTIGGITASDKPYDGNTTATLITDNATFTGKLDADTLTVTATGTFADANVGDNKTVTISGLKLGGDSAGNYQLAATGQQTSTTASITANTLSITTTEYTGTYDGQAHSISVTTEETGVTITYAESEGGTYSQTNPTYTDAGVHTVYYRAEKTGSTTVSGSKNVTITQKPITVSGITANDKTYDGTTEATLVTTAAVFDGKLDDDILTVTVTGTFDNANVGENKTVTISGLTLDGSSKDNYVLADAGQQTIATARITAKEVGLTWSNTELSYTGEAQKPTATATGLVDGDTCTVTVTGEQTNAGDNYTATAESLSNSNYKLPENKTTTFKIVKTSAVSATVTANNRTYDGTEKPLVTVNNSTLVGGEMRYAIGENATTAPTDESLYTTSIPAKTEAGTYYVWYKAVGDDNHTGTEPDKVEVKISPADRAALNEAIAEAETCYNSIRDDYAEIAATLKTAIETAKKVAENENIPESEIVAAISALNGAVDTAKGEAKKAAEEAAAKKVVDLINALPANASVGDKEAVAAARAAYDKLTDDQKKLVSGDVLAKLTTAEAQVQAVEEEAKQIDISKCKITVKHLTYTGKAVAAKAMQKAVTVKYGKKTLEYGTDYTLTYDKKLKTVGTAAVTVKGKGKYKGSKEVDFNIIPKGTSFTKVKGGQQQITLKWKNPGDITGYQIEYSLKEDFKGSEKVSIGKAKTLTATIKKLAAGKTFYVRIRTYKTVSKKNYCSDWSKAETVKTAAKQVDISKCKITVKNLTYTGNAVTAKAMQKAVTVKHGKKTLEYGTDYALSYDKKLKVVGPAAVTVKGKGNYTGSRKVTFDIIPRGTALTELTGGKQGVTLKWKNPGDITGYQIEYSLKKSFKGAKKVNIPKAKTLKTTIGNLKANTTYYVRIRTYTTVGKENYYSAWSKTETVKTTGAKNNFSLSSLEALMNVGEELDLKEVFEGSSWESSDETVATVSADGIVKALAKGEVVITALDANEGQITVFITVSGENVLDLDNVAPLEIDDDFGEDIPMDENMS